MTKSIATTAATTAFCAAKIEGPDGYLWIDGNGKITVNGGSLDNPKPNAFSLLHITDCPGATTTCKQLCYVFNLEKFAPETYELYEHNSEKIREILDGPYLARWAQEMGDWITENCNGYFRWHVSGDIFSAKYANFIRSVCLYSPDVQHWIYTRSFFIISKLCAIENLTVNLSADKDNYTHAKATSEAFDCRICYLTTDGNVPDDLPDGSVIFPDYGLRGGTEAGKLWFEGLSPQYKSFVCPVDFGGKSEKRRCGPCDRCIK